MILNAQLEDRIALAFTKLDLDLGKQSLDASAISLLEKLSDVDRAECKSKIDCIKMLRALGRQQSHSRTHCSKPDLECLGVDFSWIGELNPDFAEPFRLFLNAWKVDREPSVCDFFGQDIAVEVNWLVDVLCADICLRWRTGNKKTVESYFDEWSCLTNDPSCAKRVILAEYRARSIYSKTPSTVELQDRFLKLCPTPEDLAAEAVRARLERMHDSFQGQERFFIIRRLGEGGMGVVFEAWDRHREERVALKVLPSVHPDLLYYFKREFRFLSNIVHPNLVTLHELFSDSEQWYFTMDLVNGVSLAEMLGDNFESSDLSEVLLRNVVSQLIDAVEALHASSTLHRDIKPANLIVDQGGALVMVDFGLVAPIKSSASAARCSESKNVPSYEDTNWQAVGTATYMSPEQSRGERLTPASDWFSVGAVVFELLAGKQAFHDSRKILADGQGKFEANLAEHLRNAPEDLRDICLRLLSIDPTKRPSPQEIRTILLGNMPNQLRSYFQELLPFVGRTEQLGSLRTTLSLLSRDNETFVTSILGDSGSGKTRLVNEFLSGIRLDSDVVALDSRCYEGESVAYKAVDGIVDSLAEYLSSLSDAECCRLLEDDSTALTRAFPVLRRVRSINERISDGIATTDLYEIRRIAFSDLRSILVKIGSNKRLVLVVDDLQWGDDDSAVVFRSLLRGPFPPRLMLIACCRNEYHSNTCLDSLRNVDGEFAQHQEISLPPLAQIEAEELAASALRMAGPDIIETATRIARESGGTPYFILELSRTVAQDLSNEDFDLSGLFLNRFDQLPCDARRVLELISVAAQPILISTIAEACPSMKSCYSILEKLRSSRFISGSGRSQQDRVCSLHDRIRQCVVTCLNEKLLREHHLTLATSLLNENVLDHEWIGKNFQGADRSAQASQHYLRAAELSEEKLAFDRAARLIRLSLDLGGYNKEERSGLLARLGNAFSNAGRSVEAATAYKQAVPGSGTAVSKLNRKAAYQYCIGGQIQEGREELQSVLSSSGMSLSSKPFLAILSLLYQRMLLRMRGLKLPKVNQNEVDPSILKRIDLAWVASAGLSMFDVIEAARFQTINLRLALKTGDPLRLTRAMAWEAAHTSNAGGATWNRVQTLLSKAREVASECQSDYVNGIVTMSSGVADWTNGRWSDALPKLVAAENTFRDNCQNTAWELITTQTFLLWALFYLGWLEELGARARELVDLARDRGNIYAESTHGTFSYPMAILATGNPSGARDMIQNSLDKWTHESFHVQHSLALMARTYIDLYEGNAMACHQRYQEFWPQLKKSNLLFVATVRMFNLHLRARSCLAAYKVQPDDSLLAKAERDAKKIIRARISGCVPHGQHILAGVAAARGESQKAAQLFEQARRGYDKAAMPVFAKAVAIRRNQILHGDESDLVAQTKQKLGMHLSGANVDRFCNAIAVKV